MNPSPSDLKLLSAPALRALLATVDAERRASNGEFLRRASLIRAALASAPPEAEPEALIGEEPKPLTPLAASSLQTLSQAELAPEPPPAAPPEPAEPDLPVLRREDFATPQALMDQVTEVIASHGEHVPQRVLNWAWSSRREAITWETEVLDWVKPRLPLTADFESPDDLREFIKHSLDSSADPASMVHGGTPANVAQWLHDARAIADQWEEDLTGPGKTELKPEETAPAETATSATPSDL